MGLSGPEVVISNIPVVLGTLFRREPLRCLLGRTGSPKLTYPSLGLDYFNKKGTLKDSQAREELLFDEAFT